MARKLLKLLGFFGIISLPVTLIFSRCNPETLLSSDNPYVVAWAVSCLLMPGAALYVTLDNKVWKGITRTKAFIIYLALINLLLLPILFLGELHGPGLALALMITTTLFGLISIKVLNLLDHMKFIVVGLVFTALYSIGYLNLMLDFF